MWAGGIGKRTNLKEVLQYVPYFGVSWWIMKVLGHPLDNFHWL